MGDRATPSRDEFVGHDIRGHGPDGRPTLGRAADWWHAAKTFERARPRRRGRSARMTPSLPDDYAALLSDVKARIATAQVRAAVAANRELLRLYWDIGHPIQAR